MATEKSGVIVRLDDKAGFGYVREKNSPKQFIFGFDKIPRYRGQSARELNLHRGTHVHFRLEGEIVASVVPD